MVRTPARPKKQRGAGSSERGYPVSQVSDSMLAKKQRKVRSRADTSMPTTTRTTRSGRHNKSPPPTDGGYLSERESTPEKKYTKNDPTPRRHLEGTRLQGCMDDRHICAYQENVSCMGKVAPSPPWEAPAGLASNPKSTVTHVLSAFQVSSFLLQCSLQTVRCQKCGQRPRLSPKTFHCPSTMTRIV